MSKGVLEWLTEPDQPAVRYLAMRDLMDESGGDARGEQEKIASKGWVHQIYEMRRPGGHWEDRNDFYRPKYISTNWMLLTLSDLGMTRDTPWIAKSAELWRDRFARRDGGFDTPGNQKSELCLTGNTARALVKFGYSDDPKVESAFRWLVRNQKPNGGWHCWGKNGVIDGWEGLGAFSVYPRPKWTRSMKAAVERGAEFYLQRRLSKQGNRYAPWFRFHFPYHYYYDLLIGLEFMTSLGYGGDRRMGLAISHLKKSRRSDGRWNLDAVHPDYDNDGKFPKRWDEYKGRFKPFALEKAGHPSKMITLRAMRVLKKLNMD